MNGHQTQMEFLLTNSFESGYANASQSLTQMINCKAAFKSFHRGTVKFDSGFLQAEEYIRFSGSHVLLTTQIFGDVSGKSYLFLSEKALEVLTRSIPSNPGSPIDFKEEFIKELNKITSCRRQL
jgi:hypothetical protein